MLISLAMDGHDEYVRCGVFLHIESGLNRVTDHARDWRTNLFPSSLHAPSGVAVDPSLGTIPVEPGGLTALQDLHLNDNNLDGE